MYKTTQHIVIFVALFLFTTVSLPILLTLFSINTFAADSPPRQKGILRVDSGGVNSVAFSPDGLTLASGSGWPRNGLHLWDVMSGQPKATSIAYTEDNTTSVAFSPDGNTLANGSWDNKVRLWDVASAQLKAVLTGHAERVLSVAFSPDGSTLASAAADRTIRLWDVASGQIKDLIPGRSNSDWIVSVAFSPDGLTLASADGNMRISLWDVASRQLKTTFGGDEWHGWIGGSVAFSPDGLTLASGGVNRTVHLWDVASGQSKAILVGHTDRVSSVAFSPDGLTLASAGNDRMIRLWDVASGQPKTILIGHTDRVSSVAFSPDGSTLASGGNRDDRTIILWDLTASATTPAVLSISPISIKPLAIGEKLTVSVNIVGGENVMGYQATVVFDPTALIYFSSANGDYLSDGAFFTAPDVEKNYVTLASAALAGGSNGDGTLATITFQVVDTKASGLFLPQVHLIDPDGERLFPCIENGITKNGTVVEPVYLTEDVNSDGVVNIQDLVLVSANFGQRGENKADVNGDGVVDIVDLVKVAGALGNTADAPSVHTQTLAMLTTTDVQDWITQAQHLNLTDTVSQRGVRFLEQLLAALTPKETALLPNYPNPFNPETWIPYQLAEPADGKISIYTADGKLVRRLDLGHKPVGIYQTRSRAAHWDGRNQYGEPVASSVYFYTLTAGDFTATRKMLILK